MALDLSLSAERRLVATIAQKRRETARLLRQITRLEGQLAKLRRAGAEGAPAPRSSSVTRILVEHEVLDRLRANVPPETTADLLWPLAQAVGVNTRSTFRSHLRRMEARGLIVSLGATRWTLAPGISLERRVSPEVQRVLDQINRQQP